MLTKTNIEPADYFSDSFDLFAIQVSEWHPEPYDFSSSIFQIESGWVLWWSDGVANAWHELFPTEVHAQERLKHLKEAVSTGSDFKEYNNWLVTFTEGS